MQMSSSVNDSSDASANSSTSFDEQLEVQRQKCENLMTYFSAQIRVLNKDLHNERNHRVNQLSRISKILLSFENNLKNEQKHIRQQLLEKDSEINRLTREIVGLRMKYGETNANGMTTTIDNALHYCSKCQQQYHPLASRSVGIQIGTNSGDFKTSEMGIALEFGEMRPSKRHMNRRSMGSLREHLKSRNAILADRVHASVLNTNSYDNLTNCNNENERYDGVGRPHSSLSNHGVEQSPMKMYPDTVDDAGNKGNIISTAVERKSSRAGKRISFLKKYDDALQTKTKIESTKDWYASASDMEDSDSALSKPYGYNAVNPVLECVNQILLQQSMDANDNDARAVTDVMPASRNATAPKSPKFDSNDNNHHEKTFPSAMAKSIVPRRDSSSSYGTARMMSIPVAASETTFASALNSSNLSYATIHSNDYEVVGSDKTSSNFYIDMESKLGHDDRSIIERPKIPPALPPKPANLINLRQMLKNLPIAATRNFSANAIAAQMDTASEPDYCSISEVQDSVVKNVQIVVDVHKNGDDAASSQHSDDVRTDITDEVFADIPKLPNVDAIISPKKEPFNRYNTQDNYIMKTSPPIKPKPVLHTPGAKFIPHFLSEINGNTVSTLPPAAANVKKLTSKLLIAQKMSTIVENVKSRPTQPIIPFVKPDEKVMMPMQAEFDWYNLDAEYGKLIHSESHVDDSLNSNIGVEYNLDEEFVMSSGSPAASSHSGSHTNISIHDENTNLNVVAAKYSKSSPNR